MKYILVYLFTVKAYSPLNNELTIEKTLCSSFVTIKFTIASKQCAKQRFTHEANTQRTCTVLSISMKSNTTLADIAPEHVYTHSITMTTVQI